MQRPAFAATVVDIGNEGIAHVRRNKLQSQFISGHGSQRWQEGRLRTLWVRFAPASPLLSRRFQRAFVSLKCTEFMRMRLVRLAAITLREICPSQYIRASVSPCSRRVAFGYRREREKGKGSSPRTWRTWPSLQTTSPVAGSLCHCWEPHTLHLRRGAIGLSEPEHDKVKATSSCRCPGFPESR